MFILPLWTGCTTRTARVLGRLRRRLMGKSAKSVMLTGQRGAGQTVLLHAFAEEAACLGYVHEHWEVDGASDCPRDIAAAKGRGSRDERWQTCLCLPRPFPQIRGALVGGAGPSGGDNTRVGGAPSCREGSGEPAPFLVAQRPLPPPLDCGPSVPPRVDWTLGPD